VFDADGSRPQFIRARLRRGKECGRSTSAFFVGRDEERVRPSVRSVGPREWRVCSAGPGEGKVRFAIEITGQEKVHRVEYRYRRSGSTEGVWRHCADVHTGRTEVSVSGRELPADLKPGEHIAIDFRAYNGESYSTELASVDIAVNQRPLITRATAEDSPLTPEEGKPLMLPFSVSDEDGDAVIVLYRLGDDVTWSVLPTSSGVNVLPADLVSRLVSRPEVQKIEVIASDGLDASDDTIAFDVVPDADVPSEWTFVDSLPHGLIKVSNITLSKRGNCSVGQVSKSLIWYFQPNLKNGTYELRYLINGVGQPEQIGLTVPCRPLEFRLGSRVLNRLLNSINRITFVLWQRGTRLDGQDNVYGEKLYSFVKE
jgi:hypothetical protein